MAFISVDIKTVIIHFTVVYGKPCGFYSQAKLFITREREITRYFSGV